MKWEYLKLALQNLYARKIRSFLTLLGIVISISAIFILISVSLGLQAAVMEQFRLLGTDKFFVQPLGQLGGPGTSGVVEFTEQDVEVIRKVTGVKEVAPWTMASAKIEFSGEIRYVQVMGIDLDTSPLFIEAWAYKAEQGRLLEKGDSGVAMIGSQYSQNNFLGREIQVGNRLLINDQQSFKVKGILKPLGNPVDDRLIYLPYEEFRPLFNIPNRIDVVVVQIKTGEAISTVANLVEEELRKFRHSNKNSPDFVILTPEELLNSFKTVLNIITAFLLGIAGISLVIGGIGIANTMYTSVLERTKEIGLMKAIGAGKKDLLMIFLVESGLLGLAGGIIAVGMGITIDKIIEHIALQQLGTTLLRTVTPPYLIIGSLVFSVVMGAVSGLWPAWRAWKVKPVEALRQE